MSMHRLSLVDSQLILNLMSLQCDNLSGELQDQWSSSCFSHETSHLLFQLRGLLVHVGGGGRPYSVSLNN